jgi:tRNA dimethylallyltransferase
MDEHPLKRQQKRFLMPPELIIITGATATGKTDLGVALAQHFACDVISCDSQLVYQGLNIGTAKPTTEEQQGIAHWGMDLVTPDVPFSAAMYEQAVLPLIVERLKRQQPVILVGGTGFYLRQILEERPLVDVPPNPAFRAEMTHWASQQSEPFALHQRLQSLDAKRAWQLYPQDDRRILRALEIIHATGQAVPQEQRPSVLATALGHNPQATWLGLTHEDKGLRYQRIEARIDAMIKAGWLEEVEHLAHTYGADAHALQVAHGYPELLAVLNGSQGLDVAKTNIAIHVRQYARRQKVWFNRHKHMQWLDVSTPDAQHPLPLDAKLAWALERITE